MNRCAVSGTVRLVVVWGAGRVMNIAVALACGVAVASCSSDDGPDTSDAAVVGAPTVDAGPDGDASPATVDGPSSEEADVELLAAVLLTPAAVGVPDTWAIRDLDPDVPAEQLASDDLDIAFGVAGCPLAPPATGADGTWLRRSFAAPDEPLDNGLLAIEIVAEVQDDGAFAGRLDDVDRCLDEVDDALVGVESQPLDPDTEGVVLTVGAAPSALVAFPSRHGIAIVHAGERTVTVAFSGIDQGQDWSTDAVELADRVLELLAG
jgi:hypothetical protein